MIMVMIGLLILMSEMSVIVMSELSVMSEIDGQRMMFMFIEKIKWLA